MEVLRNTWQAYDRQTSGRISRYAAELYDAYILAGMLQKDAAAKCEKFLTILLSKGGRQNETR